MNLRASTWPVERICTLFGIDLPIIQAPMAGAAFGDMVSAVSGAGGLGSLACAMLSVEAVHAEVAAVRARTNNPINLNFFCHPAPQHDRVKEEQWRQRLAGYYAELGVAANAVSPASGRAPFDNAMCEVVEQLRPEVVSFHFGLPSDELLHKVRRSGAKIVSSATTVEEARWLEERGCDAVIAQGYEGGGHRGAFLASDMNAQVGTMALLPQVVDAVGLPVIAAGGIGDGRGIAAAFALGAAAVQIGTAYLFCPEAKVGPAHREALRRASDDSTMLTNVFTGRPARGIVNRLMREVGPFSSLAPDFPGAASALAPLRAHCEAIGSTDFVPLWCGQAAGLGRELPAALLTQQLARDALDRLRWPR